MHDWGDSAAVVFVASSGTTHLIDGDLAGLLAAWDSSDPISADLFAEKNAGWLEAQMPTLLQTGIFQARTGP